MLGDLGERLEVASFLPMSAGLPAKREDLVHVDLAGLLASAPAFSTAAITPERSGSQT